MSISFSKTFGDSNTARRGAKDGRAFDDKRIVSPLRDLRADISFVPHTSIGNRNFNARMLKARSAAIFEDTEVRDLWMIPPAQVAESLQRGRFTFYSAETSRRRYPQIGPFNIHPETFLMKARSAAPSDPQPTASAFGQWVYSLYGDAHGKEEDKESGVELERTLLELRRMSKSAIDDHFLELLGSPWRLIHMGLHERADGYVEYMSVPGLSVQGVSLRASPDLIYRNHMTGDVIIVEIKNSKLAIPTNLWPNVWAQLWCYAQLPIAARASRVTVVGEVWADMQHRMGRGKSHSSWDSIHMRASVRRDPRKNSFDSFFRALFGIYSGQAR